MFENRIIGGYDYASRFIMSWVRAGGRLDKRGTGYNEFKKWLTSLNLSDKDIDDIMFLASNGKLEYEISAKKFIERSEK